MNQQFRETFKDQFREKERKKMRLEHYYSLTIVRELWKQHVEDVHRKTMTLPKIQTLDKLFVLDRGEERYILNPNMHMSWLTTSIRPSLLDHTRNVEGVFCIYF